MKVMQLRLKLYKKVCMGVMQALTFTHKKGDGDMQTLAEKYIGHKITEEEFKKCYFLARRKLIIQGNPYAQDKNYVAFMISDIYRENQLSQMTIRDYDRKVGQAYDKRAFA